MAGLQFHFAELVRETKTLKAIARDFLDPSTIWVLDALESNIESLWGASDDKQQSLTLQPLKTIESEGGYESSNRGGGLTVRAVITGIWDVRPLGNNPKKVKAKQKRLLEFCGVASTKIELFDARDPGHRISMWRMELGAEDAPGCYFHVQVLGDEDESPFPKAIPIPRLPSIFITPMGVIEYVLGELFQDQWAKAATGDSGDLPYWRNLQRTRLLQLFKWHGDVLAEGLSSPWMALKEAKPKGEMFLS